MTPEAVTWIAKLGVALLGGAVMIALLRLAESGIKLLPISRAHHDKLQRFAPPLGIVIIVGYVLFVARLLIGGSREFDIVVLPLVLAGLVAAAWNPLKDVVNGVVLKAGDVCSVGDTICVGNVRGRVVGMGYRVVTLETPAGEEVVIPYTNMAAESVSRVPVLRGAQAHVFELVVEGETDSAEVMAKIQRSALLCHWSSVVRSPEVRALPEGAFQVTVFPLVSERAAEIEQRVRRAVRAG